MASAKGKLPASTRYRQLHLNVAQMPKGKASANEITPGLVINGRSIVAKFKSNSGRESEQKIELTFLLAARNLAKPLAWAFHKNLIGASDETRPVFAIALETGFIGYLIETKQSELGLPDLTSLLLQRYRTWIQRSKNGKLVWKLGTQKNKYRALTRLVRILRNSPRWKHQLPPDLRIPVMKDPKNSYTPTPVLNDPQLEEFILACFEEIDRTMLRRAADQQLIDENRAHAERILALPRHKPFHRNPFFDNRGLCLAALDILYPDQPIPTMEGVRIQNSSLARALFKSDHRLKDGRKIFAPSILRHFHPIEDLDLFPFLSILALLSSYNPSTILPIKISDFQFIEILGRRRIALGAYKAKSFRKQRRSFPVTDDLDNPAWIFEYARAWTGRLRNAAPPWCSNRLFLVRKATHPSPDQVARPLRKLQSPVVREFCEQRGLKPFQFRSLRHTSLDVVERLFKGDVRAVQAASNHRNIDTIGNHYTSDAARERNWERLAQAQATRRRHTDSKGRIDSRSEGNIGMDIGASTPGWSCLDPFSSPMPGQVDGKLCSAFGACPVCPHAQADCRSPYVVARILQLRDHIVLSQAKMPAPTWLEKWMPRLDQINKYWLPLVKSHVMKLALTLKLSPLPPLE